ncbi:MAG TPA: hypothetical protein VM008_09660 [Phycisphaerae bacterium]|nr:hypothetical protein [Phycisphaerae bacterium]
MLAPNPHSPLAQRRRRSLERNTSERLARELLLERAAHLPETEQALLVAHFSHGIPLHELAILHRVTERRLRRRLEALRRKISHPAFGLTIRYAQHLRAEFQSLATARWIDNRPLRTLAAERHETLHQLRQQLAAIHSQMLFLASHDRTSHSHTNSDDELE